MIKENMYKIIGVGYLILFILGIGYINLRKDVWTYPSGDFISYIVGAKILTTAPDKLYDLSEQKDLFNDFITPQTFQAYKDLPITSVIFVPLEKIYNLELAWHIWLVFNCLALFLSGLLWFKNLKLALVFFAASLLFYPVIDNLLLGQVGIVLLFITAGYKFGISKQYYYLAGASLGLLLIKPALLFLVPFLVLSEIENKEQLRKTLIGFGVVSAVIGITLAGTINSTNYFVNYEQFSRAIGFETLVRGEENQFSVYAILRSNFSMLPLKALFFNIIIASAFLIFLAKLKVEFKSKETFALVTVVLGVLSTVSVFPHGLIFIFPYLFQVVRLSIQQQNNKLLAYVVLLYFAPIIATQVIDNVITTNTIINIVTLLIPTYFIADS